MIRLHADKMMLAKKAIPNPEISKLLPMILSVSIKVMALMTNRNKPRERIVTGSVRMIRIGLTSTFRNDKMMLAKMAAPIPVTWNPSKKPANAIKMTALISIPIIHLII